MTDAFYNLPFLDYECLPVYDRRGLKYEGQQNSTVMGIQCMQWIAQTPHFHGHFSDLPENLCRNPDSEPKPWCYTMDKDVRWQMCPVQMCGITFKFVFFFFLNPHSCDCHTLKCIVSVLRLNKYCTYTFRRKCDNTSFIGAVASLFISRYYI